MALGRKNGIEVPHKRDWLAAAEATARGGS
jgi:hypothetical protein